METRFDKLYEHFVRLVEDDMGGGMPPPDGGGGGGGASEPPEPCFTTTGGIEYMFPFIRLYNKAKETGSLPKSVTSAMIADRAFLEDMLGARVKLKLKKIFRLAGISDSEVLRAQKENIRAYQKTKEGKGGSVEIRPVGASELKCMLDVIGILADKLRDDGMHETGDGRSAAPEVGFANKGDIDYSNIWVAYNRIVADVKGEYRSGV